MKESIKPFRVLTLDGGGMRGLYTATLLQTLASRFNANVVQPDIGKNFDLICGTSTGAILACALAKGVPLVKIRELYNKYGKQIFPKPMPKGFKTYLWAFNNRKKAAANVDVLKKSLSDIFADSTLKSVYEERKIALCIPAVNANNYKAWVFKTPHNAEKRRDDKYMLKDVCCASSAAPIFFPINKTLDPQDEMVFHHFIDGGLWANNPILVGLLEALTLTANDQPIELISVGTCDTPNGDPCSLQNANWGVLDWKVGVGITEASLSAQSAGYSYMAGFFAAEITKLGKKIKIIRLKETLKSPDQYSAISLDKADQLATETLMTLAKNDADLIHSEVLSDPVKEESRILREIFSNFENLT